MPESRIMLKKTVHLLEEAMYQEKAGSCHSGEFDRMQAIGMVLVVLTLTLCAALPATAVDGQFVAHNTPPYVASAENLGAAEPSKTIEVSLWLNLHNRSEICMIACCPTTVTGSRVRRLPPGLRRRQKKREL